MADCGAGTAAHVHDPIVGLCTRQPFGQICVASGASESHAEPDKESEGTGEPG